MRRKGASRQMVVFLVMLLLLLLFLLVFTGVGMKISKLFSSELFSRILPFRG